MGSILIHNVHIRREGEFMRRLVMVMLVCFSSQLMGQDLKKPRYSAEKFATGYLKYESGIPIVVASGTPEEIGQQFGELAIKQAQKTLLSRVDNYVEKLGWQESFPQLLKIAPLATGNFPKDLRVELDAAAKQSGVDRNLLIALNLIPDQTKIGGCSTLVVQPERSALGQPLFARNLDWPPHEEIGDFTLVYVAKTKGKKAVAMVTLPCLVGCISGMNESGLCVAINEITASKDQAKTPNLLGTPMLLLFRRILEECSTVDEAEKLLRQAQRTTYFCLTVCDTKGGCVLEVTPKSLERRSPEENVTCCTNHFRTEPLCVNKKCARYDALAKVQANGKKLGVADVYAAMDSVNQGQNTIQTMVFEPVERVLHLSFGGSESASKKKPIRIDLKPYFDK